MNDGKKHVDRLHLVNGATTPDYYPFARLLHFLNSEMQQHRITHVVAQTLLNRQPQPHLHRTTAVTFALVESQVISS